MNRSSTKCTSFQAKRVLGIAEEFINRKLDVYWGFKGTVANTTPEMLKAAREAGCVRAHYGVETFTDEGLKSLGKNCSLEQIFEVFRWTREAGIKSVAYMIIGCPHQKTRDWILKVRDFVRRLQPDYVMYSLYTPYPDAPILKKGVERPVVRGMFRTLRSIENLVDFKRILKGGWQLLKMEGLRAHARRI